ncbi:signal peptide peptidase-domain-containing protein [Spinellus fusiger]|nr:signal peptide peptidase-domain-containing protein [Spinellus fusiger]
MSTPDQLGLYIAYGALTTMALVPIYAGSFASLKTMKRPDNAPKPKPSLSPLDDSDEEEQTTETLTTNDALLFPLIASCALFSLYLMYRYVDERYLNYAIAVYFSIVGCLALTKTSLLAFKNIVPLSCLKGVEKYKVSLSKSGKRVSHVSFTMIHIALAVVSVGFTAYYTVTKHWIASNVFGLSFSINALQLLSLGSFATGMSLLAGLFFYDIFWVFGTEVMVSVARNFDAPIKVLWPRDAIAYFSGDAAATGFSMLGLGDIVIPGAYVALCLHFDRHMSWKRNPVGNFRSTDFPKPYFTACYVAYFIGLATTMAVMHVFHAAQPALLYLSPACILSSLLTAAVRGELKELFSFSTEEKEEERDKKQVVETIEIETEHTVETHELKTTEYFEEHIELSGDEDLVGLEEDAEDEDEKPKSSEKKNKKKGGKKK